MSAPEGFEIIAGAPEQGVALFAALVKAQAAATSVVKDATNKHHKYDYASAEALITLATEVLGEARLAFVCVGWRRVDPDHIAVEYMLAHEAGAMIRGLVYEQAVLPSGGRPPDKAISTATTYVQSYALRGLLNIPRVGNDDDADQRDDRNWTPQRRISRSDQGSGVSVRAVLDLCDQAATITGETKWQVYDRAYRQAGGTLERSPKAKDLPPAALAKVHAAAREILANEIRAEQAVGEAMGDDAPEPYDPEAY